MATVASTGRVASGHRRREVIDVDAWDDEISIGLGRSHRRRHSRHRRGPSSSTPIIVLDSDDEEHAPASLSRAASVDVSANTPGSSSPRAIIVLDDDDAVSTSKVTASSAATVKGTLVCARCLDPLMMSANDITSEEERKMRRIWALHCGHMLDGKCIEALMQPPASSTASEPVLHSSKGKAKAKPSKDFNVVMGDVEQFCSEQSAGHTTVHDRKGKRKAVEPLEREQRVFDPAEPVDNIRSRLRSRHSLRSMNMEPVLVPLPHLAHPLPHRPTRTHSPPLSPRLSRAKGKGKGKSKAHRKLAKHQWVCPIVGCDRVHVSVRVGDVWTMHWERGAVVVFA
ncbi:hypothetical protein A0H81_08022 [Grifola frondosa]|uniref:Uncharacterized protein n=1 Tax=Grifola frondosa TaxID=5627 RepID=A0A1C7MBG2_GRIFR|nr:hypothetical protein A0H81_08022 [Grifola frondosa]